MMSGTPVRDLPETRRFRSGRTLALAIGLSALTATAPVVVQTEARELDTVTVIGTGLPTEVLRNPASITVITSDAIEQAVPVSIASLLRDVPGVQISEEGIERIEVVRGSSSVVSGSSAIGGVINIITRRGAAQPFSFSATAGYLSGSRGHRLSATAAGTVDAGPGALDYNLSLGRMKQGDRRTPDG